MKPSTKIPPVWLFWFTCLGSLAAYFWATDDRIAAAFISVVGITGMGGYWLGGTVVMASIIAMLGSSLFAKWIAEALGPAITELCGATGVLNGILAVCFGCLIIGLMAMLVVEIGWNRWMARRATLRLHDRALGLSLGAIQGVLLSMIFLGGSLIAEPYAERTRAVKVETVGDFLRQCTADSVSRVASGARNSTLTAFVATCNPFERVPPLKKLWMPNERSSIADYRRNE